MNFMLQYKKWEVNILATYYDGQRLCSMKDINGELPEIFIATSNRSAGKTVYYSKKCVEPWIKKREKFALLYRYQYELDDCADKFFKDISNIFYRNNVMTSKRRASGIFHELELDGECCGYAISLNSADALKKYSHLFSDVQRIMFDEFQSESNRYCNDEIRKFISIHTSIARGNGEQVRYVPVYMVGNPVSIINPYYVELGISSRLRDDTKFLRGNGYVLEQGFVSSASEAQKNSSFNKAFAKNDYVAYSSECVYLNDNKAFIEKPSGTSRYLGTLKYLNCNYGIREYSESGFIYVDSSPDLNCRTKITVTSADHEINYVMLKRNDLFLNSMRYFFEKGCFRFKDLKCKEAVLKALSY